MLGIDVVVCTMNSAKTIAGALGRIRSCVPVNRLIVVDGGSTDDIVRIAEGMGCEIYYEKGPLGAARDLGLRIRGRDPSSQELEGAPPALLPMGDGLWFDQKHIGPARGLREEPSLRHPLGLEMPSHTRVLLPNAQGGLPAGMHKGAPRKRA